MDSLTEYGEAMRKVTDDARALMAMHRRMMLLASAAIVDADKLQKSLDELTRLEQELQNAAMQRSQPP